MILAIYGFGGMGREILVLAEQVNTQRNCWEEIVFLDDNEKKLDSDNNIFSFDYMIDKYSPEELEICIGIGEPAIRESIYNKVKNFNYRLVAIIHPQVFIPKDTVIQEGVIINAGAFISCGVVLERNVLIQPNACIAHDSLIKEHSVVSSLVCIAGACTIGRKTYIGINSSVREMLQIGDGVIIGMGSVVTKNLKDNIISYGNPAEFVSKNNNKRVF